MFVFPNEMVKKCKLVSRSKGPLILIRLVVAASTFLNKVSKNYYLKNAKLFKCIVCCHLKKNSYFLINF